MRSVQGGTDASDLRHDLELVGAIVVPVGVAVVFLVLSPWWAYLGVASVAFTTLVGARHGTRGLTAESARAVRWVPRLLAGALSIMWALVATGMVLGSVPTATVAGGIAMYSWICIGYGWITGWLVRRLVPQRTPSWEARDDEPG